MASGNDTGKEIKQELARKYTVILLMPILVGLLLVFFWRYVLYANGIYFNEKAETPVLYLIIPLVGFIYVIFASIAVNSALDKYKTITKSITQADVETYLLHREAKMPALLHILVGAPSLILVLLAVFFNYPEIYIGGVAVFSIVFVVSQTWIIVTELDNFHTRKSFKAQVPQHWHEIDTKSFFESKVRP